MTVHAHGKGIQKVFQQQADASLSQANPVSGTKYTVLATTKNVRIISIEVDVTWSGQPTPLEIHVTVDGVVFTFTVTDPASATAYFARFNEGAVATSQILETTQYSSWRSFLLEGRSVKVEAEITGGTVSSLDVLMRYVKM